MIELLIRQTGQDPVCATLANGADLIGAGRNCHLRLDQPDISGRHAQLIVSDAAVNIMDLGSRNGTFINKSREPLFANQLFSLVPGTVIRLGKNVEMVVARPAVNAPPPAPQPAQEKKPEPDPVTQKLESMEQKINDFIVAMQKNNLKTASVNILPDDQIDNSANTALSELIRPAIKKEEKP